MNFLTRAKMSSRLILSFPLPSQRLSDLHPRTPSLRRFDFYSTKTPKPKAPPSSTFSQRIRKQTEALSDVWPKPGDMPYQAKVANFVNLIGRVELPVRFECSADGRYFASAVISIEDGGERKSPMVPVVFQGDLAHVVSCHVKENDCVFVSGHLSVGPTRLVSSDSLGKFHVVGENVSFVEGFKKKNKAAAAQVFDEMPGRGDHNNMFDEMPKRTASGRADYINGDRNMFDVMPKRTADDEDREDDESVTLAMAHVDRGGVFKSKPEKDDGNKKKDDVGLWRDLVRNQQQWWDFRSHKSNGLVHEKHPDFKQKVTGESLWINSVPTWLLPGIGRLVIDVMNIKPKQVKGDNIKPKRVKGDTVDDSWKDLVENPNKWWDNRIKKKNPKGPDFKHKETGAVLWLDRSPAWVLSKLPQVKN